MVVVEVRMDDGQDLITAVGFFRGERVDGEVMRTKEGTREKQPSCLSALVGFDGVEMCAARFQGAGLQAGCKVQGKGGSGAPKVGRKDSSRTTGSGRREEEDKERMAEEEKSEARMRNGVKTSRTKRPKETRAETQKAEMQKKMQRNSRASGRCKGLSVLQIPERWFGERTNHTSI